MRRSIVLAFAFAASACSPNGAPRDPEADTNAVDAERAAVENLTEGAEIDALKQRVATLENEMIELKAAPQTIDLEMLTKRVEQLEAGAARGASTIPAEAARVPQADADAAQRAVDAAIADRRKRRDGQD